MQGESPTIQAPPHCTLCALGIPGHVGQDVAVYDDGGPDPATTPVQVYLQRRRLGLPTRLVPAGH